MRNLMVITAYSLSLVLTGCSNQVGKPRSQYFWMMKEAVPEDGVKFWVPVYTPHDQCDHSAISPAFALATVYVIRNDIDHHTAHYHLLDTDVGFILVEYESGGDGERERAVGADHFHGLYIPLEAAKKVISSAIAHEHGAKS
jgi:hypothetical protein